jgi:hypothetical protein
MRGIRIAAFAAALCAAGCGKDPSPAPSPSPTPAGVPVSTEPVYPAMDPWRVAEPATPGAPPAPMKPTAPATMKITVVEKGAEPRTPLRYRLTAPAKGVYEIVTTQKNRTGDVPHLTVQTTTTALDWDLSAVDASGNAQARMTMQHMQDVKATIPGQSQENVDAVLAGLRMHISAKISPFGGWSDVEIGVDEAPSGQMKAAMGPMMDSMSQTMGQVTAQFPSEPVGVGAKWVAELSATMLGMTIASTITTTLVSRTGDDVVLAQTSKGGARDQKLDMAGVDAKVLEASAEGKGTMSVNLARALPDAMEMTTNTTSKMQITVPGGTPRGMDVVSIMEMKVTRKN